MNRTRSTLPGWEWASGQGREKTNRETIRVWEPGPDQNPETVPATAVIASGVGADGGTAAAAAAAAAAERLENREWKDIAGGLEAAAEAANHALATGKDDGTVPENGAAALLLVAMKDDSLTWWNIGNSTLLHLHASDERVEIVNRPTGTATSPLTPGAALMGMPYGEDPEEPGEGPEGPAPPRGLEPGDTVMAATAGLAMLAERRTEEILREATAAGDNPAEEILRAAMLTTPPGLHNLAVAVRRTGPAPKPKRKAAAKEMIVASMDGGTVVHVTGPKAKILDPRPSQEIRHYSKGFGWGYRGSGALQLSLAILLEVTGIERSARKHHEAFHEEYISRQVGRSWKIGKEEIRDWLDQRARAG